MKKLLLLLSLITTIALVLLTGFNSFASGKAIATPDVSILINAEQSKMQQSPISINGSTLLPLRQLVTNLGVKNDTKHIGWNPNDKSINIVKDSLTIKLKVGSKTAYVNGKPVTLTTAPVMYNGSVYIPTRFVSQCLNKKVVWNSASKSVIITDQTSYNEVKKVIAQTADAMKDVKKVEAAFTGSIKMSGSKQLLTMPVDITGNIKADSEHKSGYMKLNTSLMGISINMEQYLVNNCIYSNSSMTEGWTKKPLSKNEIAQFNSLYNVETEKTLDDSFYSALKLNNELSTDEQTVLSGKMILSSLYDQLNMANISASSKTKVEAMDCKIYINKSTHYIDKLELKTKAQQSNSGESGSADIIINVNFTKYNGNFTITLPTEAKNAVKM